MCEEQEGAEVGGHSLRESKQHHDDEGGRNKLKIDAERNSW